MEQATLSNFLKLEYSNLVSYVKSYWNSYRETEAEDIVQDVAAKIFTSLDVNTPIENLAAYFYRSLRNKVIDNSRKKQFLRFNELSQNEKESHVVDDLEDQRSIKILQEEQIEQIYLAMDLLKAPHKEIILLTEFEGYSFEELSREIKVPIGTLLSRKHRAMAQLQKIINTKFNKNGI